MMKSTASVTIFLRSHLQIDCFRFVLCYERGFLLANSPPRNNITTVKGEQQGEMGGGNNRAYCENTIKLLTHDSELWRESGEAGTACFQVVFHTQHKCEALC